MSNTGITLSISNPTGAQTKALNTLLKLLAVEETGVEMTTHSKSTTTRPEATVSPDEDADWTGPESDEEETDTIETGKLGRGKKAAAKDEDEEETEESEEDEDQLSFDMVKDAINEYGGDNPAGMKKILTSFNLKSTKELKAAPNKWEPVYRKVMAKLK